MNKGLDWGTASVVACDQVPDKEDPSVMMPRYRTQRNCYVEVIDSEFTRKMIERGGMSYIQLGGDDRMLYVIGDHAIELAGMMSSQGVEVRRPMAAGTMQGDTRAMRIMQGIASSVLDEPDPNNNVVVYSLPAAPIDDPTKTIDRHQTLTETALRRLGWEPKPIPEALAIIYSMTPKMVSEDANKEIELTGLGMSFGGGMVNVCISYRGMPTINFSIANAKGMNQGSAGDWIDGQMFNAYKVEMGSLAACTMYKERFADFTKVRTVRTREDDEDLKAYAKFVASKSHIEKGDANWHYEVLASMRVWYHSLLDWVMVKIAQEFNRVRPNINGALEIVIAGGTATPPGFENILQELLDNNPLPFDVSGIRKADKPLWTVARGCQVAAEAGYAGSTTHG
jgi:hypothetical protein